MLKGIGKVVRAQDCELGKFYYSPWYKGGVQLLQCVETRLDREGPSTRAALYFATQGTTDIALYAFPDHEPLIEVPGVGVRVDPNSQSGTAFSTQIVPGMLFVDGDQPHLVVPLQYTGRRTINLTTGQERTDDVGLNWIKFDRWSLVSGDDSDETVLANFEPK